MVRSNNRQAPSMSRTPVRPTSSQPSRSSSTASNKSSSRRRRPSHSSSTASDKSSSHKRPPPSPSESLGGIFAGFLDEVSDSIAHGTGQMIADRIAPRRYGHGPVGGYGREEQPVAPQQTQQPWQQPTVKQPGTNQIPVAPQQTQQPWQQPTLKQPGTNQIPAQTCSVDQQNFIQCYNANHNSVEECQFYFNILNACQTKQPIAAQQTERQTLNQPGTNQTPAHTCSVDQENFVHCYNTNHVSIEECQFYFDSLNACQKGEKINF